MHFSSTGFSLVRQDEYPVYFPLHFISPPSVVYFDLDFYSENFLLNAVVKEALESFGPVLTRRLLTNPTSGRYAVLLIHPGAPVPDDTIASQPGDVAVVSIVINSLLQRLGLILNKPPMVSVYLFDSTNSSSSLSEPMWLGGVRFDCKDDVCSDRHGEIQFYNETTLDNVRSQKNSGYYENTLDIASREWTVVVVAAADEFQADLNFLIFVATMFLVVCILLALWLWTNHRRQIRYHQLLQVAESEKASLLLESANTTAKREREMNDFIAHGKDLM